MEERLCSVHSKVEQIVFTYRKIEKVLKGHCISHTNEYTDFKAMDEDTGQYCVIKEICFNSELNDLEVAKAHLSSLIDIQHKNIFKIKNFVFLEKPDHKEVLYILQEFDFGYTSFSLFLSENVTVDTETILTLSEYVKDAALYLEGQNIQHVNTLPSAMYINSSGNVKLYDYGLEKVISSSDDSCTTTQKDTFKRFLISFLQEELEQPEPNVEMPIELNNPVKTERRNKTLNFDNNFEVIEKLGKGGFGKVYKVKDKAANKLYALKKIKLRSNKDENKILNEVKYLAELEHKHIVRYYHAWKEYDDSVSSDSEEEDDYISDKSDSAEKDNSGITNIFYQNTLYIKMELCEGNSLAHLINETNLYEDSLLIWKYFKQILKGLQHIHGKDIIHRDLKPSNILLDSNNQIKIGDFGFATNRLRYRPIEKENLKKVEGSGSYTSRVGTALYKAPELYINIPTVSFCDHKLDMYSLGIVLFEMCYKPFKTLSEKVAVLTILRSSEIGFPSAFNHTILHDQVKIIRDLLNHNPAERPSCKELLESEKISYFPEDKEEERQLQVVKRIANNPRSIINFLNYFFKEIRENDFSPVRFRNITYIEATIRIITDIFRKHGGQNYDIKKSSLRSKCRETCNTCIKSISEEGKVIVIPCSSRLFFHQFVSSNYNSWMKGYSIFEDISKGYICKFDIITPIDLTRYNCHMPEAEILLILSELMHSLSNTSIQNFTLRINHSELREAVIEELRALVTPENGMTSYSIGANQFLNITKLLDGTEITIATFSLLQNFQNPKARIKAEASLTHLLKITDIAKQLGVNCKIILQANSYLNSQDHKGMIVQLLYQGSNIAEGGRYQESNNNYSIAPKRYAVGLSVYPEKIVKILKTKQSLNLVEVFVCCFSNNVLTEVHKVLKNFWGNNISCSFIKMNNMKSCYTYCIKNKYSWIIVVKEKLLQENKVLVMNRKNRFLSKWVVRMENLVSVTKTLLRLEPYDNVILGNGIEILILFRTTTDLSFFDKVKYKFMIKEELENKTYSQEKLVAFVVNFDSNLFVDKKPKGKQLQQQSIIYEDMLQMELDERSLIIFAFTLLGEDMVLKFSYYTYHDNKLILLPRP